VYQVLTNIVLKVVRCEYNAWIMVIMTFASSEKMFCIS